MIGRVNRPGLIAAAIAAVDDVVYVVVIHRQGDSTVVAWAFALIAIAATTALLGAITKGSLSITLLAVATALLFPLGVIGIFSIGLPLLIASMFSLVGVVKRPDAGSSRPSHVALTALAGVAVGVTAIYLIALTKGGSSVSNTRSCSAVFSTHSASHVMLRSRNGCGPNP
jgi:hypothetical protein